MTQPAFFSLAVKEKKIIVRNKQDDFGLLFYFFVSLRSAWWSASDDRGHVSHHTVKCWMFGRVTLLLVHYKVSAICIFLTEWINTSNANLWTFLKLLVIKCFYICLHVYVCAADFASSWPTGVGETRRQKRERKKTYSLNFTTHEGCKVLNCYICSRDVYFHPSALQSLQSA